MPREPASATFTFPISNDYEKYDTSLPEVRAWLRNIVRAVEDAGIRFPLYVHCLSGRDRTGVVIAAFLKICGAHEDEIVEEYRLSLGAEHRDHIHTALEGLGNVNQYFRGIDLRRVRAVLGAS